MSGVMGFIAVFMIVLQTIGVLMLDLERLLGDAEGFIKFLLIIATSVPYITMWIAAINHDRLKDISESTNRIEKYTLPKREVKTNTSVSTSKSISAKGGSWVCKKCGEHNENTNLSCKNCGEYK